jgi:hypothetical protein
MEGCCPEGNVKDPGNTKMEEMSRRREERGRLLGGRAEGAVAPSTEKNIILCNKHNLVAFGQLLIYLLYCIEHKMGHIR